MVKTYVRKPEPIQAIQGCLNCLYHMGEQIGKGE